jgi:hypothetical protein
MDGILADIYGKGGEMAYRSGRVNDNIHDNAKSAQINYTCSRTRKKGESLLKA